MLGNPIIWWSNLIALVLFLYILIANAIKNRRRTGKEIHSVQIGQHYIGEATLLFIGWVLHYLPFWAMGRVLYFHHYFPALIFNSMLTGKYKLKIIKMLNIRF